MPALPVSVIIPAHNAAATLPDTLESLLAQTSPQWEAIIIENGSTDHTASIAARYAERDTRIRLHRLPEAGVSAARNVGLADAQYERVLFLDADDTLLPQHLEILTNVLHAEPEIDVVHCGWLRVTPSGAPISEEFG
ncbi:MAG TPA: glycosyltransferase family A protein, partial [Candidatus Synoicihabitans sp.]|nr:glycosyltransferase family A protein [Candidatus Synoicihabitans sp.]